MNVSGTRTLRQSMSTRVWLMRPASRYLRGGMRIPSWKISVAFGGTDPGDMPPTSWWWVIAALKAIGRPPEKMGMTSAMSGRWVPPR